LIKCNGILKRKQNDHEIEKEFDGALPCGDDMVRAEWLRACPDSQSDVGRAILKNAFEETGLRGGWCDEGRR